jgi:hypothetical protein
MKLCNLNKVVITLLFGLVLASHSYAEDSQTLESSSELTQQLEDLKSQVLQLNRELFILEEDLLFPASTQIALFVSVDTGRFFAIDSVEVKINDKDVAGFLYTDRQRDALEQGGIQKLYLGNLKMGPYQLTAIFTGVDQEGRMVKRAAEYEFEKEDDSLMIELKVVDNKKNNRSQVVIDEWVL